MLFNAKTHLLLFKFITSSNQFRFKSNLSILFYGSNRFSLPTLKSLHSNLELPETDLNKIIHSLDICTKSLKNDVGYYSKTNKLNLNIWPYEVPKDKYDIGIVVSFGELIPKQSIDACSNGILNAHASLLPKLRGAAPIFRAILNDYKETGVTIMRIKADKFDVGDIILQESVQINENTKAVELYDKLSKLSANLLMKCLKDLDHYLNNSIKQNEQESTNAFKIKSGENMIKWNEMDLKHVYKLYRAFDEFYPIYTYWIDGRQMKLFKMIEYNKMLEFQDEINKEFKLINSNVKTGTLKYFKNKKLICIKCKDYWAGFSELSLKGNHKISSQQFNNGYLLKVSNENKEIVLL